MSSNKASLLISSFINERNKSFISEETKEINQARIYAKSVKFLPGLFFAQ